MPIQTYSDTPYHDDFSSENNYLRILFRPGRSVQVRELNQLQSNLQDQIDKFGRHVFKDGDRVLDGYTTYDGSIRSIPIEFTGASSPTGLTASQLSALKGKEIQLSGTTNVKAKVLGAEAITGAYYRLYVKYIGTDTLFDDGDTIELSIGETDVTLNGTDISAGNTLGVCRETASGEDVGYYGGVFQDSGIFFVKGHFVFTDNTEAFYVKSSETSKLTGNAVFDITESIITSGDDISLLDNATGQPNLTAPGADRYKISLNLKFIPSTETTVVEGQQRITLLDVKEDIVTQSVRTQYSELGKTLAQRTEDESGSYVVNPFKHEIREYLNDEAGNRGKYTADQIYNSGDSLLPGVTDVTTAATEGAKRYVLGVEPGVAYIQGYRTELEGKQDVVANKGNESSDVATETAYKFSADRGQYIEGAFVDQDANLDSADFTNFIFAPANTYQLFASGTDTTLIGTCRIQAIENSGVKTSNDTTPEAAVATKRLYIYDLVLESNKTLSDATVLCVDHTASSPTGQSYLENTDGFVLHEIGDNLSRMVYPMGDYDVKDIDSTNTSYVVQKRYSDNSTASSTISITAGAGDSFISTDPDDYVIMQNDAGTDSTEGETYVKDVTISGSDATLVLVRADGSAASNASADPVTVFAPVQTDANLGIKKQTTGTTFTETRTLNNGDIITLDKVDVYEIESVSHDGNTLSLSDFELVTGQSDTQYGYSQVVYKGPASLESASVIVTFSYFEIHTAGDFFSANSYTTNGTVAMALEDIPVYEDLRLSNCLDFRPSILTSTEGESIKPNAIVNVKFDYYKPRKDIVTLNQLGDIQFIEGVASKEPVYPQNPSDSLILYRISKPGYVYSLGDIEIDVAKNRRYTMKDIGSLENRIQSLEYYASLSQLESEAAETQLNDSSGPRYKSGILTDSFRGHGVGNVKSAGYRSAIDRENFTARPTYLSDNARWQYIHGSSDMQFADGTSTTTWNGDAIDSTPVYTGKRKNAVTLDFIEQTLVDQPYASNHISVNPYDVATWSGSLELSPSSDEWKNINFVPDIIENIEGDNSALIREISNNPNILGTEWNEWESQWSPTQRAQAGLGNPRQFAKRLFSTRRHDHVGIFERDRRQGIQTSLVTNFNREVIDDKILNITFVPFIRSRKVFYKGSMLKPNTTFYLYFDDVNITPYAVDSTTFVSFGGDVAGDASTEIERFDGQSSISGADGSIISDAAGNVEGWFVIPNNDSLRFRTGSRQVRLTDKEDNNRTLELSSAETTYHAKGLLETRQRTILSTRQLVLERTRLTEQRNLLVGTRVVRRDPVAQTFMIGNEPTGIFLSSIDIYFQEKDPNLPVELSIVSVENGIPTQKTIPLSKVLKSSTDVNVDATSAASTTNFRFDTPIYLQPGIEYAIVLISNSARYRVWHAEVGGTDVGANKEKISKNVNLGVMLKSQNASTWTPDQNKDLKFKLNRADFITSPQDAIFSGLSPQREQVTYIDVTDSGSGYLTGAPAITIAAPSSGTTATAKAHVSKGGVIDTIEVVTNGSGYTSVPTVTIAGPGNINIPTGNVTTATDTITLPDGVAEMQNGQPLVYNDGGGTSINGLTDGDTYYAITYEEDGSALYEVPYSRIIKLSTTDSPTSIASISGTGNAAQSLTPTGTAAGTAEVDVWKASSYLPIIQDMLLPESSVDYLMNVADNKSYTVYPGELIYTDERVTHDSSSAHDGSGDDMLKLQATLSTTNSKISPVIDLDRISLVTFDNLINNSSEFETLRDDGECMARYISKSVKLSSPADQINVYFDAMRPDDSTSIEVYAKFKYLNSNTPFEALGWTKIDPLNGTKVPVSTDFRFNEVKFEGSTSEEYDEVAVKVLFKSSDKTYSPEIKNLRIIATL